jgi:hypothetical protein
MSKSRTSVEEIVYGLEPIFDKLDYSQTALIGFINWYNYNATHDQLKQYTIDYFREALPEVVSTLEEVPKTLIPKTLGTLCRMLSRGYPISNYILGKIDTLLKDLLTSTYEKELLKPVVDKKPAKIIDKAGEVIADIDGYIDNCITTHTFPKKDWNKTSTASILTKKEKLEVAEYYVSLLDQLKNCEDEYDMTKPIFDKYVVTVQNIVEAFTIVTPRKVRAPKPINLDKVVSKVKYLKEYDALGLKSINPKDIIGSKYALLYDTKYKKLQLLIAEDRFTIRGSTVYGVNKEISISKMVKYPNIIANKFMVGNFEYVLGSFRVLTTKISIPSGAINEHTLILRIIE